MEKNISCRLYEAILVGRQKLVTQIMINILYKQQKEEPTQKDHYSHSYTQYMT